jgi:hypothetical protein
LLTCKALPVPLKTSGYQATRLSGAEELTTNAYPCLGIADMDTHQETVNYSLEYVREIGFFAFDDSRKA